MRHLFHAVGNCCIMCGVPLSRVDGTALKVIDDPRAISCPGPASNVVGISHRIAEAALAKRMHYNRPFRSPSA